jgi:hypothetical protein
MSNHCDTTRRYARSLNEAFADERASWFERPQRRANAALWITYGIALYVLFCAVFFWGKP